MKNQRDTINDVIGQLAQDGILEGLHGNCVLASDVIQNMLETHGIHSRMVEVTATVTTPDANGSHTLSLVGYNMTTHGNDVATHVVVVTESETPLLIDASIGHLLRNPRQVIIADVNASGSEILCRTHAGSIELVYRVKRQIKLPNIHQKDLVSRLRSDNELRQRVRFLTTVIWVLIAFGCVNFSLNVTQILLKLFYQP